MRSLDDDNFCAIQAQDKNGSVLGNLTYAGGKGWSIERNKIVTEDKFTDRTVVGNRGIMTGNADQAMGYYYSESRKVLEFYLRGTNIGSITLQ